jgi:hypothetical protein
MDASIYSKENVIKSAFKIFDKNAIGKISPNHLHELFLGNRIFFYFFEFSSSFLTICLILRLDLLDNAYYAKKKIDYWADMVKCCDYKNDGVVSHKIKE